MRDTHHRAKYVSGFLFAVALLCPNVASAEGIYQVGLLQRLAGFQGTGTVEDRATAITVDILNAGEVINLSACGGVDADPVTFEIIDPDGIQVLAPTPQPGTVPCNDPMDTPLNGARAPEKYVTAKTGQYEVRIINTAGFWLDRFDVTVTPSTAIDPDPTGATGIVGRVASKRWYHNADSFAPAAATNADYYVLTPGGIPDTNYVWKLDLNFLAGFVYEIIANGIGVDSAPSFSVPEAGNNVTPLYDLYLNPPSIAKAPPQSPPSISNFRFLDDAGQDITFSPGFTIGVQDTGTFSFETDTADATFAIAIDTGGPGGSGPDGVYGGEGDVFLNGYTVIGTNTATWDGTDVLGNRVPDGNYTAQLSVRLGEFHFVGRDIETSGGTAGAVQNNGLTVWEIRNGSEVPTYVYYDDESVLNGSTAGGGAPNPSVNLPNGALSGTAAGYHSWGNFTGGGFGNQVYIDTFVYGRSRTASSVAVVASTDGPPTGTFNGFVQIDAAGVGDDVALLLSDEDLDGQPSASGIVTNTRTGDTIAVTLSPSPSQPGTFLFDLPTTTGATTATELSVQAGDTLSFAYNDAANSAGVAETFTDTDVVGGTDGTVTINADVAGSPATLTVTDADVTANSFAVTVINTRTNESEQVTVSRIGTSDQFVATLPTAANGTAGANNNGTLNVQSLDVLRVTYLDALRANGLTDQPISDTDSVKNGTPAFVSIDATRVTEPVTFTVTDGDRSGFGSVVATITNVDTGEAETVTLTERPGSPGVFDGSVATIHESQPSGALGLFGANRNDVFRIDYNDDARPAGSPPVVSATGTITGGETGTAAIAGDDVGTPLTLTVTDADLAGNGTLPNVIVRNQRTNGTEIVTLIETAPGSGIFTYDLPTQFGALADGNTSNNSLNVSAGDVLVIEYSDAIDFDGATQLVTETDTMTGGADGVPGITGGRVGLDPVQLTLTDTDLTGSSIVVAVTNLNTGEVENITLTGSAGSYTGSVATVFGTSASTDTTDATFNAQAGDVFEIAYSDAFSANGSTTSVFTQTAPVTGGNTGLAEVIGTTVGAPVTVRYTDADLPANPFTVTLTNGTRDSETVTLSPIGGGVFEATVNTAYGTGADGSLTDGSINAVAGDTLAVSITDAFRADGSSGPANASDTLTGGTDGAPTIVATTVGAPVDLTVQDDDLIGQASITVTVLNVDTGESETVTLNVDGTDPSLFTGTIATQHVSNGGGAGDATIDADAGDILRIQYVDDLAANGSTPTRTADATILGGQTANVTVAPTTVGAVVPVSVLDPDLTSAASVTATVTNLTTGEAETITLLPDGVTPGRFVADVPTDFGTAAGTAADGRLNAQDADLIEISYVDPLDTDGAETTIIASNPISGGSTGVPQITAGTPGAPIQVEVTDPDLANGADFTVRVENVATGEFETVTVSETTAGSGVFVGTLPSQFGTSGGTLGGTNGDGTLRVEASEQVTVTYADALRTDGSNGDEVASATVTGGNNAAPTITATTVGADLQLRIEDADLIGAGTINATVTNDDIAGESQPVTLTETAPGVFEVALPTTYGTAPDGSTSDNSINASAGDTLTLLYTDLLAQNGEANVARSASAIVSGGDTASVNVATNLVGDDVTVTVTDADRNNDGTIQVVLENIDTGESRTVTLVEGPVGTFSASFPTAFLGSATPPTFGADAGDVFRATYQDDLTATGASASPSADATIGGGVDATIGIVAGPVGDPLTLTVEDPDLPAGTTSVTVTVSNGAGGEVEEVTLTGSGGIFSGTLPTAYGTGDGSNTNGSIDAVAGQTLTLSYTDPFSATGGPAPRTASAAPTGGQNGTVSVSAGVVGDPVTVTVTDDDLTVASGLPDPTVTLVNGRTGESETLVTTRVAGTNSFTVSVITSFDPGAGGDPAAGAFFAQTNDVFTATYTDAFRTDGGSADETAATTIGSGNTGVPTLSVGPVGTDATITINDPDLANGADFTVIVTNDATGESETVSVSETAPGSGIFTGTLATTFGTVAGTDDDGTINVQANDGLTLTYADALRANGSSGDETAGATVPPSETGTVTVTAGVVGDPVTVSVTDGDLAGEPSITVDLVNVDTGETQTVTLLNVGGATFEASFPTVFGTAANSTTAAFEADAGDVFEATYNDARTFTGEPLPVANTDTIGGGADATLAVSTGLVGEPVTVTLTDADIAGTTSPVTVSVVNSRTGETRTVTLTETSPGSGTFTGNVQTAFVGTPSAMEAKNGDVFTATYADDFTATGDLTDRTATGTVSGGTTATAAISIAAATGTATLTVTDPDLATAGGTGTVSVSVTNTEAARADSRTVTLTETGPNSGVFTGTIDTIASPTATTAPIDMAAQGGDLFTISFDDPFNDAGGPETVVGSDTVGNNATGAVAINAITVGDPLQITVTDGDLAGASSVPVTLTNDATAASVSLTLTPTAPGSDTFIATLPTVFGTTGDLNGSGELEVAAGMNLTATYADAADFNGNPATASNTAPVAGGTDGTLVLSAGLPGEDIVVTLTDADLAGTGPLTVTVTNGTTPGAEAETIQLVEGPAGTFTGSLPTTPNSATGTGTGIMFVLAGDQPTVTVNDDLRADGSSGTLTASDTVQGGTDATISISVGKVGEPITVTLVDPDISGTTPVDVTLANLDTPEGETVSLTYVSPGTFSGTFATVYGTQPDGTTNGSFAAVAGDEFRASYTDPVDATGAPFPVADSDFIAGGAAGTITLTAGTVGEDLTLVVEDADLVGAPAFTVDVTNPATGETEAVTVLETSPGRFEGTLPTTFGTAADGANTSLPVEAGVTLTATYTDALLADGSSGTTTDTATPLGGATGTLTITAGVPGDPIEVRLVDADLSGTGPITLTITNGTDSEQVSLVEGPAGTFVGTVPTAYGTAGDGTNGSLVVAAGDTPGVTYTDALRDDGSSASVPASDTVSGGTTATVDLVAGPVGDPATLTVTDPDRAGNGFVTVTLTNPATGDSETVVLPESPSGSGIFTDTIATDYGTTGTANDNVLTAEAGNLVTLSYTDPLDASGASTTVVEDTGTFTGGADGTIAVTVGQSGGPVTVTVTDADLAGGPDITVDVENIATGEIETITLTESATPGTFVGSLATVYGTADDGPNGTLPVASGDQLVATYADQFTAPGGTASPTATGTVQPGETGTVSITAGLPGDSVTISLTDLDVTGSTDVTVTVVNGTTGESEEVTLTETATAGTFTASLPTNFGAATGPVDDDTGTMLVEAADVLTAAYDDALTTSGATGQATDSATVSGGNNGTVTITATTIGEPLTFTLNDPDLAGQPDVQVQVTNGRETEIVTLTASPLGSADFAGSIPTVFGTADPGPGTMGALTTDVFTVTYGDALAANGGPATVTDTATPAGGNTATISATNPPVGDPISITVVDPDRAGAGPITVEVTNPSTGEVETVSLTETATPGEFAGTLPTTFGTADDGVPGQIAVEAGTALDVVYADPLTNDGSPQDIATTATPTGGTTGVATLGPLTVGDPAQITLTDPDIAGAGSITVVIANITTGDSEIVTLTENASTPGTFEGTVATTFGTAVGSPDGTLEVAAGDPLTVTYTDGFRDDGSSGPETATATVGGGNTGTVATTAAPIGSPQEIVIVDPDLAGEPSVTVTVTNPDTGGTQQVVLSADPSDPTRFVGSLSTVYGTVDDGDPNDGTLPVAGGTTLTVTYNDALTNDGSPQPVIASLTPLVGTDAVVALGSGVPGDDIAVTLVDPDLAGEPTVAVTITNGTTGETETIVLSADPSDPTRFTAPLGTAFGTSPGPVGDDAVNVAAGDVLTATYTDPLGTSGGPTPASATTTIGSGNTAVVDVTPGTVGTPYTITVTDPDLTGTGPLTATVTTPPGDTELVTLVETGTPGVFTGDIPTAIVPPSGSTPGDGTLSIEPGTTITVSFDDPLDATGGPQTVSVTEPVPNGAPVGVADTASVAPGDTVIVPVLLNDSDPEGSPLSIASVTQPATGGTVAIRPDGTLSVTADPGFLGTLDITYVLSDPQGETVVVDVTVTVDGDAPTAVADVASAPENTPVVVDVLSNDLDPSGTGLTISSATVDTAGAGTVAIVPGGVEFTPAPGFTGPVQITYEVTNGLGLTDTATISIDVTLIPVIVVADTATIGAGEATNIDVTANDPSWDPTLATISIAVLPTEGTATVRPDGTIDYIPNDPLFSGTDTFTYEMCIGSSCSLASVTVTINPPEALLTGTVFRDLDHDGVLDTGAEPGLSGWTVEVRDDAGTVVGTTVSSGTAGDEGAYALGPFATGQDYTVRFLHPVTGELFDEVAITLAATGADVNLPLPIDPSGVVYDSVTREPVEGATVTIASANPDGTAGSPLPGACLLGRDTPTFVTGPDGYYEFFLVPGGAAQCPATATNYALTVVGPNGQGLAAGFPPVRDANGTPTLLDPTGLGRTRADGVEIYAVSSSSEVPPVGQPAPTYYMAFTLGSGDPQVVNNHLPLAVTPQGDLLVTKTALTRTVSAGQLVPYRITVRNASEVDRVNVTVVDDLPAGFRYRDGSSAINGNRVDARVRGRNVQYRGLTIPANGEMTISLVAVAGSTIAEGTHTNLAFARNADGTTISNIARADVEFAPHPDFDCATVIGRVFEDANGNGRLDAGEEGLAGVRIATVEGVLVTTGAKGRYHLPCAMVPNAAIGSTHVMKLDPRTLPFGYTLQTRNPQMVRLTRGKMTKVNFAVTRLAEVRLDFSASAFHRGSMVLLPEYEAALGQLIETLRSREARLNLVYHAQPGEIGGRERMRAIAERVERMWRRKGEPYELSIERTVERSLALGTPRLGTSRPVTKG